MIKTLHSNINTAFQNIEMKKSDLILPLFAMIFCAAHIGTNLYSSRLVSFHFFNVTFTVGGGIFIFPLTFFVLDTVTEYFGMTKAILLVFFNIITLFILTFCFWYVQRIPTNNADIINEHYKAVTEPFVRAFFATTLSNIVGYVFNILFLDKMRKKFGISGRVMFYRLVFVTAIAEIIYSLVWVTVYMIGKVNLDLLSQIIGSNFLVKVFFQILSTPFTIVIVNLLRRIDNRETLTVENPFLEESEKLWN